MPIALLLLVAAAGGLYAISPKRASLQKGQARICFDQSTAAHLSELRVVFSNVVDEGNGCYRVTVPETALFNLPAGARIGAVQTGAYDAIARDRMKTRLAAAKLIALRDAGRIGSKDFHRLRTRVIQRARFGALAGVSIGALPDLYAVFLGGKNVGFAFGLGPARAMAYSYPGLTFKRSTQPWPKKWDPKLLPIWGDADHRTTWGRFFYPQNLAITDAMKAHYQAFTDYPAGITPYQLASNYVPNYLASR